MQKKLCITLNPKPHHQQPKPFLHTSILLCDSSSIFIIGAGHHRTDILEMQVLDWMYLAFVNCYGLVLVPYAGIGIEQRYL